MNNALGVMDIPLSVFGGAIPEMAPEDLPEGASPWNQDVDFTPGSVFTRGGRVNQISYFNLFSLKLAGLGSQIAAANQAVWTSPNNITVNSPPTYASVALNTPIATTPGIGAFDQTTGNKGTVVVSGPVNTGTLTPGTPPEFAIFGQANDATLPFTPAGGWTLLGGQSFEQEANAPIAGAGTLTGGGTSDWVAALMLFKQIGASAPTVLQTHTIISGAWAAGTNSGSFTNPITAGSTILVILEASQTAAAGPGLSVTDAHGNTYIPVASEIFGINLTPAYQAFAAQNVAGGAYSISGTTTATVIGASLIAYEIQGGVPGAPSNNISQILQATNFPFLIPSTVAVLGFQILISGKQTTLSPDAVLKVSLINPSPTSPITTFQLGTLDGTVTLGTPTSNFGLGLTPALFNNPAFGLNIQAFAPGGESVTFNLSAVQIKVYLSPSPPANMNWLKTYEQSAANQVDTLFLDANGLLWDENVTAAPTVLNSIFTGIIPGSFADSVTFDDVEYIAFSNLINGTDMPRQWNGQWLDRVSQVAPGAPPSFATTASGSAIVSITQQAPTTLLTGSHDWLLISAAPSDQGSFGLPATPGNVMTIIPRVAFVPPTNADGTPLIQVGSNIQISGFPTINGQNVNNDPTGATNPAYYTVTSVGLPIPGQQSFDWITFQVPFTTFYNQQTPGGCNIQATIATLTAAQQVPFLEVGNQFTVTGATPSGWNNTFTVQKTPNASQLNITQSSLTGNVATFVYTLITGTNPVVGQFVTTTGLLNGPLVNGISILNVVNAVITAATPTQFSISLQGANIAAAPETNATGIISGTIFYFDPAGTVTNPIIGNTTIPGSIATSGVLGVGARQAVVMFMTRNNLITGTSPPVTFNITANATAIVASSVPIGPPNTIARVIAFTGAGGANFFYLPRPQTVVSNGQNVTYSSTVINDNTSTQVTLSFPDGLLLSGTAIDVLGANNFSQMELGSSKGFVTYSERLIAWGEQNKVQNFLNLSFDGGIGTRNPNQNNLPTVTTFPLGWTADPVNGNGGTVNVSPLFGNSYYVKNSTGSTQALYGMIEQPAFQDAFQVPIIATGLAYSVRVTARCPSGVVTGALNMDLFSPKLNQIFGIFTVPLASMTTNFAIFTGTMLTKAFTQVPMDLIFRVYGSAIPNGGDFEIDRVEPFPTKQPNFATQLRASYAQNQEAFDLVTGAFGPAQNQQAINGAMVVFDSLYALKERSIYQTADNGVTEPFQWTWKEVSNKVGTIGIHSYDYGTGWAFTADRNGLYFFNGGEPIKVSQEIQPVWELVNWQAAGVIWVRNDEVNKRVEVGVPITTPNPYMPEFPVNTNPTLPNVVLMMNYRELNEGMAIAQVPGIKSTFSGRLISPEPARKWSFWNMACPYADFIDRANNQWPLWHGTGYSDNKVFQVVDAALSDDGLAINSYYLTYGFCKAETQEAKGLGLHRMVFDYLTMSIVGNGNLNTYVYPDTPSNTLPLVLDFIPLSTFSLGDLELNVNIDAQRFFCRYGTNAVGASFRLSKVVASLSPDPWAPVRGTSQGMQ